VARKAQAPGPAAQALRRLRAPRLGPVPRLQPEPLVIGKPVLFTLGVMGGAVAAIGVLAGLNRANEWLWGDARR
jgi:hypothetical protein